MKIAQIAPLAESCPPRLYGGTERIVSYLTEELVAQGHEVTLFASGDSVTAAKLVSNTDVALRLNPKVRDHLPYSISMLDEVGRRADEFDVLHFHVDLFHFPMFRSLGRTLTTLHGRQDLPDLYPFYKSFPSVPVTSISYDQRRPLPPEINWVGNVYHGLPNTLLPFSAKPEKGYLAFLGRISPEKRPDRAIEIATKAGLPLLIAAKVDKVDQAYWDEIIEPMIKACPLVTYIGEINDTQKAAFLGNAAALLFPIDWPEPFGLVMIEAMACGTPVIAFRCGSVPEVIDDGITGYLVNSIDEAVAAVHRLPETDRGKVRDAFDRRFTVQRMARDYEAIYRSLPGVRQRLAAQPKPAANKPDLRPAQAGAFQTTEPFYVAAAASLQERPLRILKHDDIFAVFDQNGDTLTEAGNPSGIFFHDTRYLSELLLTVDGARPILLSSTIRDDNATLTCDLTNPDFYNRDGDLVYGHDLLHVRRSRFLWNAACYERIAIRNFDDKPRNLRLAVKFDSDFADLFEVRGNKRSKKGSLRQPQVAADTVMLGYVGLDEKLRQTRLRFAPKPSGLVADAAMFDLALAPRESQFLFMEIQCDPADQPPPPPQQFFLALRHARRASRALASRAAGISTSNETFNESVRRNVSDLYLLTTKTKYGPYPYAGIPWFSTVFGRDALITSLQTLWLDPSIARGVLGYLAENQATETNAAADSEPGKILHEVRHGEMAELGEVPFRRYYGSIDSTPLFVMLAGAYLRRTGDLEFIRRIWGNIERALTWIEKDGDRDGDGFVEYGRRTAEGLANQGWKDSQDAIFHEDGSLARGTIALAEVQAYVYGAWTAAAEVAQYLGYWDDASRLEMKAHKLRSEFDKRFCSTSSSAPMSSRSTARNAPAASAAPTPGTPCSPASPSRNALRRWCRH